MMNIIDMKKYCEQLRENCIQNADVIAFKSAARTKGLTYSELWEYSGSVYAYLKQHSIGKEDMVFICLPRGIRTMVAAVGIIRSGAAFVIVESTYAKDRIEYIKSDCGCKLTIDANVYEEMMSEKALDGYEDTNPHDAAFAVYTSGSTGNPKGVLHEYGKIEQVVMSTGGNFSKFEKGSIVSLPAPLNFVTSIIYLIASTYYVQCLYILPYEITKDIDKLTKFLQDNKVTCTFMSPSLLRLYKNISPYLQVIRVGSEPCNGIFIDYPRIFNEYCSSETVFSIASFEIDKTYDITPAGKNRIGVDVYVVDKADNKLPNGQTGEICVYNEYTRGYINSPEKNRTHFKNGIFYTGDLGYFNENNDLVVIGRKDDMIKINGNRVEPAEIETAIRKALKINNIYAKGFAEAGRTFICAYFLKDELIKANLLDERDQFCYSAKEMSNRLSGYLPYYMIPSHYIVLEEYPKSNSGKVVRKDFRAPVIEAYRGEYVAPANKIEEYLCELFEMVLNVSKVSANDDFYVLGGDSITSIKLISNCDLQGLSTTDIYKFRTPHNIAEYYNNYIEDEMMDRNVRNVKALEHEQSLLPEMQIVIDCQEYSPDSVMWNLPLLFRLKKDIDISRLCVAVDKVLHHHPIYSTQFHYDVYSVMKQKYVPDSYEKIKVIDISEGEFAALQEKLVKPFSADKYPLCRKAIYKTESDVYLFIDHYHIITDGTSLKIIFEQISKCYSDENYTIPEDYYYLMLRDEEKKRIKGEYDEIEQYYKEFYQKYFVDNDTDICLKPDRNDPAFSKSGIIRKKLSADKRKISNRSDSITENEFFIVACLLSLARYNDSNKAFMQWTFHGRDSKDKADMAGLLFRSLPAALIFNDCDSVRDAFDEISKQVQYASTHDSVRIQSVGGSRLDDSLFLVFQKGVFNKHSFSLAEETIQLESKEKVAESTIEMMIIEDDSEYYECKIEYDTALYNDESILRFYDYLDETVNALVSINDLSSLKTSSLLNAKMENTGINNSVEFVSEKSGNLCDERINRQ